MLFLKLIYLEGTILSTVNELMIYYQCFYTDISNEKLESSDGCNRKVYKI